MLNANSIPDNNEILKGVQSQISKICSFSKQKENLDTDDDKKPSITLKAGEMPQIVDQMENALIESGVNLYQRAGCIVRIIRVPEQKPSQNESIKRDENSLVISPVDSTHLAELCGKVANWIKYDSRKCDFKSVDCPEYITRAYLARKEWLLPLLVGVIQAPTLRSDGSILDEPGYDEKTGLYFDSCGTEFPKISAFPTKKEAEEALNTLLNLLVGFPFVNESSKSVALSAILTGLIRKSIKSAPLHGFTAPKMGSGKSLLADIVGLIATGRPNCVISQADNEAEEAKRLLAVLSEGDPIVCYDNIERPFGSAALCSALTQSKFKGRILGESKTITVLTNATFLATGNNLTFTGDISTRALLCQIDAKEERPEERSFSINLHNYIPQKRGELVKAALTILRAYHIQSRPKQNIKPFGRFEDWSDFVRSALVWVGMEDPCKSRMEIEESDPVRLSLINLLAAWYEVLGDSSLKAKEVVKRATEENSEAYRALKEALSEFSADNRGEISQRKLGNKLSSCKGRIENGFRLESPGKLQGTALWRVKKV